ncbi:MAG: SDR family NAD(P)-dependent oxidoreductase [Bacteroidales bacterium]|nr:SDR family NAD(P)-dependent oxidoreductase [Bacteroidales bacterium]
MKRAVIMGATSGMGWEISMILWQRGWTLGIAGRREERLRELRDTLRSEKPSKAGAGPDVSQTIEYEVIDIERDDAPEQLLSLIGKIGGMDLYFHGSGVGWHNKELDFSKELKTVSTNALGFTRMVTAAWHYFKTVQEKAFDLGDRSGIYGHIAVISSIAGVKGLGPAPSYSATKSFDNTYIQALAQLTRNTFLHRGAKGRNEFRRLVIYFTDIRPGFVDTPLLDTSKHKYPMLMDPGKVARKIVRAVERKKRTAIIDFRYRILVFFWRLVPNFLWERIRL